MGDNPNTSMADILYPERDAIEQTEFDGGQGDMYDGSIPGQTNVARPVNFGYYDFTPSQRFAGILLSYIVLMTDLQDGDLTLTADQHIAWVGWGANDQDALDAGRLIAAREGWEPAYDEFFGEGVSAVTQWPRLNGGDGSDFEKHVSDRMASLETIDRESRIPKPAVVQQISGKVYDTIGLGGWPAKGSAEYLFLSALNSGNKSVQAQQWDHRAEMVASTFATAMTAVFAGELIAVGATASKAAIAGSRLQQLLRGAAGGLSFLNKVKAKEAMAKMGSQISKFRNTKTFTVAKYAFYGNATYASGALLASLALGLTEEPALNVYDGIHKQLQAGEIPPAHAQLVASAINAMTGEEIPEYLRDIEGWNGVDLIGPKGSDNRRLAEEKIRREILDPIFDVLYPDDDGSPAPVTGDAADWEGATILAAGAGVDLFGQSTETGIWGDATTPTTVPGDTAVTDDTTATVDESLESYDDTADEGGFFDFESMSNLELARFLRQGASGEVPDTRFTDYDLDLLDPAAREEVIRKAQQEGTPDTGRTDYGLGSLEPAARQAAIREARNELYPRLQAAGQEQAATMGGFYHGQQAPVGGFNPFTPVMPTITPGPDVNLPGTTATADAQNPWVSGVLPRYDTRTYEGIQGSWSIPQIEEFQQDAIDAGLIEPEANIRWGSRDPFTRHAFTAIVTEANANGNTWEDQLKDRIVQYQQWLVDNPEEPERIAQYGAFIAPTYRAPDYASLAQSVQATMAQKLGRRPSEAEMQLLVEQMSAYDKQQWGAQVQADRQTHAARARAFENERDDNTVAEQSGGTVQGVDAEARFLEFFNDKFSGEIKHRERVDQVQGKQGGLFASLNRIAGEV